jgi:hypothetical protein
MSQTPPPARFRDLLAAEWIKLVSLRSTRWVLGLGALVIVALNVQATFADLHLLPTWAPARREDYNWLNDSFGQTPFLLLMVAAGTIGAISVAGEYATGMIRTTFAAVPARRQLMAAKTVVVAAVTTVAGTIIAVGSFTVTQAILHRDGVGFTLDTPGVRPAMAASALLAPVCALIGMAVGALIRHTAAATVAVMVLLVVLPDLLSGRTYRWVVEVHDALPRSAWAFFKNLPAADMFRDLQTTTAGESWLVLAVWPLAAALIAVIAVDRREL